MIKWTARRGGGGGAQMQAAPVALSLFTGFLGQQKGAQRLVDHMRKSTFAQTTRNWMNELCAAGRLSGKKKENHF